MIEFSIEFWIGTGFAIIALLVGIAMAIVMVENTKGEFRVVVFCFLFSSAVVIYGIGRWEMSVTLPARHRTIVGVLAFALVAMLTTETIRWAHDRHLRAKATSNVEPGNNGPSKPDAKERPAEVPPNTPARPGSLSRKPQGTNSEPPKPSIGIFIDCSFESFPIRIPPGGVIHVLRVHPAVLKSFPHPVPVMDVGAESDKERIWPVDSEAPPLPMNTANGRLIRTALVMKCTIRKFGEGVVQNVLVPLQLSEGTINLLIDPLDSSDRFSFYVLNANYEDIKPGTFSSGLPPIVGSFPKAVKLVPLGESELREVPLSVSFRANSPYNVILLTPVYRRWRDIPPAD